MNDRFDPVQVDLWTEWTGPVHSPEPALPVVLKTG